MDKLMQEVLKETKLLSELGQTVDYTRYESLVEMRQKLIDLVAAQGTLADEQQRVVREIMTYDPVIISHMQLIKEEASESLARLNGYKRQKNAYDNQDSIEGYMFDRKK